MMGVLYKLVRRNGNDTASGVRSSFLHVITKESTPDSAAMELERLSSLVLAMWALGPTFRLRMFDTSYWH